MLWLVWLASNTCMWMNDVAAAWVMTSLTTSPTLIALVQTASSLPVFLLGLPSGALADIVDRRRYFMVTQFWIATNAAVLYLVAFPATLTRAAAAHAGLHQRHRARDALAGVRGDPPRGACRARSCRRALALNARRGEHLARGGPARGRRHHLRRRQRVRVRAQLRRCRSSRGVVLYRWKREAKPSVLPGERFIGAMRLGFQFVRESRRMRDAIVRTCALLRALDRDLRAAAAGGASASVEGGARRPSRMLLAVAGPGRDHRRDAAAAAARALEPRPARAASARSCNRVRRSRCSRSRRTSGSRRRRCSSRGAAWILVANSVTDRRAARAARLGARARHGDLPDGDHGRHRARRGHLGKARGAHAACRREPRVRGGQHARRARLHARPHARGRRRTTRRRIPSTSRCPRGRWSSTTGPVMVTIEYLIDPARRDEFEAIMAETPQRAAARRARCRGACSRTCSARALRRVLRLRHLGRLPAPLRPLHRRRRAAAAVRHALPHRATSRRASRASSRATRQARRSSRRQGSTSPGEIHTWHLFRFRSPRGWSAAAARRPRGACRSGPRCATPMPPTRMPASGRPQRKS